jgi:hypothetical protein
VSAGSVHELVVPYDPSALSAKVERRRRLFRSRLVSLGITVVLMVALYLWQRDRVAGGAFVAVYGLVIAASVAWVVGTFVAYRRARAELARVGQGVAVRIDPTGLSVAGLAAAWPQVAKIDTVKNGFGREPALRLTTTDGREARLGLDQVVVYPATLDSTVRAFSAGRHGVDLNALEN